MARTTNIDIIEKLKDMEVRLPNGELEQIQNDLRDIKEILLDPGMKFYIYPGLRHQMQAVEDCELFEFSTEHFDSDSYRVIKGD